MYELTEQSTADRFATMIDGRALYCHDTKVGWYLYQNGRWVPDAVKAITDTYRDLLRQYEDERRAARAKDDDQRANNLERWIERMHGMRTRDAILKMSGDAPSLRTQRAAFDTEATNYLLNCLNCTVDLRMGMSQPHNPAQLLTKQVMVNYNPDAQCPKFLAWLTERMGGDESLVDYLRRALGATLFGHAELESIFFFYGAGSNGKSTLAEVMLRLLGADEHGYAWTLRPELFMGQQRSGEGNTPEAASLQGRRLVIVPEPKRGAGIDDGILKRLSSRDLMTATPKWGKPVTFRPSHSIVVLTNHAPAVEDDTDGFRRRFRLLLFDQKISEAEKIDGYEHVLLQEAEGILAWLISGARDWHATKRLETPMAVHMASTEVLDMQSKWRPWLDACCVIDGNPQVWTPTMELYRSYADYTKGTGMSYPDSYSQFARDLRDQQKALGITYKHKEAGSGYLSIRLR